jgi:hypothetical protein
MIGSDTWTAERCFHTNSSQVGDEVSCYSRLQQSVITYICLCVYVLVGLNWKQIISSRTDDFNMEHAVDTSMIFLNEDQEPLKSAVFDQY